jgi:uncharacterized membrane protein
MTLSEAGESRIRGYLYMLETSLRGSHKREFVADAVREVESHILERVREAEPMPNERDALNRLLEALGPPHRLARAYVAEMAVDEAVSTGRLGATARAIAVLALQTTEGFFAGVALLMGYLLSIGALLVAVAKPIFPNNVGIRTVNGEFRGAGWELTVPPGAVISHGWWLALFCLVFGLAVLWLTHRGTRRYLARVRQRRGGSGWLAARHHHLWAG